MTHKISNLTLDLFFFNIRQGLGDSEKTQQERKQAFLKNFPFPRLQKSLKSALEKEEEAPNPKYIELLSLAKYPDSSYSIEKGFVRSPDLENIEGYYFPVIMNDIYGVLLELELNEKDIPINYFKRLKEEVSRPGISIFSPSPKSIEGNIGKTWLLSCQTEHPEKSDAIAKTIYKEFISDTLKDDEDIEYYWQKNRTQGKFLGADVIEIWIPPQRWENIQDNNHIVIAIYPNSVYKTENFANILGSFYHYWMLAFAHRNKILYAYIQTRRLKRELTVKFAKIREAIQLVKSKPTLKQLQDNLEDKIEPFSEYVYQIKELNAQLNAIKINMRNYTENIQWLNKEGQETNLGETNLTPLLDSFKQNGTSIYQDQIEHDYDSLSAGIEMIDTLLNTIRGIVETRQSQRDRQFQELVGIIGIGLGSASITASAVSSFVPKQITEWQLVATVIEELNIPQPLINRPVIALSLSLITGTFFALLTLILLQFLGKNK
ncbi:MULTISPECIES: hypothetical protein [Spirulina sp. CCY15215]|uniref:hypothetical protein n=1 Tax=Spirulina sp. CCY15215 TaxID=2767591 RepID=UPI00194F6096|nr:hypothetical protein [Spirulina major]